MKNLLFALLTIFSISIYAQDTIPNSDFERWTSFGSFNEPDKWQSPNSLLSQIPQNSDFVVSSTMQSQSGTLAVLMETRFFNFIGQNIPGVITNGAFSVNMSNEPVFDGGTSFTVRPDYITGYYKYYPGANDTCGMAMYLFKYNTLSNQRDTIGFCFFAEGDTVDTYKQFIAPIDYLRLDSPDSILIIFSSSITAFPSAGSKFFLDNLSFGYFSGIESKQTESVFYPNPAEERVFFNVEGRKIYSIFTLSGNEILQGETTENSINVSELDTGFYIIRVKTLVGEINRKLIIK